MLNANITLSTNDSGMVATYRCADGQISTLACLGGTWAGPVPDCEDMISTYAPQYSITKGKPSQKQNKIEITISATTTTTTTTTASTSTSSPPQGRIVNQILPKAAIVTNKDIPEEDVDMKKGAGVTVNIARHYYFSLVVSFFVILIVRIN